MRYTYRREPGRLVLSLSDMDLGDRLPVDQSRWLRLDLGRAQVIVPLALDWELQGAFYPVRVIADPQGREWAPVEWTDTGKLAELWTPADGPFGGGS